jgi:uncharacterized membrane protein YphA (DoxX/SURF4 family)
MKSPILHWILRLVPAILLLQTLFFKFTASEESVYIFTQLGVEPWGRIISGIIELLAAILIIMPSRTAFGALAGMCVMAGAVLSHLTVLGIEIMGDGGLLFILALVILVCCSLLVLLNKSQLANVPIIGKILNRKQ